MTSFETCGRDLQVVLRSYHLPDKIEQYRNIYLVNGEETRYILKKLRVGTVKAYLIGELLSHNGLGSVLPHLKKPRAGGYYFWYGGNRYILTKKIDGREADYKSLGDLQAAIRTMSLFHRLTQKLIAANPKHWALLKFNPVNEWQKCLREMENCRDMAIRLKCAWSKQYLNFWYMFFEEAGAAIAELENYNECTRNPLKETICYHDWAYHNVIIHRGTAFLIDFDYMLMDHAAHDRANLIERYLRLNQWSTDALFKILWNFDRLYHWQARELKLVRLYLSFPYDYWMLGRQYFIEKQPWSLKYFQDQWERKISFYKQRNSLLNLLKTLERE